MVFTKNAIITNFICTSKVTNFTKNTKLTNFLCASKSLTFIKNYISLVFLYLKCDRR